MAILESPESLAYICIRARCCRSFENQSTQLGATSEGQEVVLDQIGRRPRFDEVRGQLLEILVDTGLDHLNEENRFIGEIAIDRAGRHRRGASEVAYRDRSVSTRRKELEGSVDQSGLSRDGL